VLQELQKQTETLRKQYGDRLKDFGPKWELCGPGEAYVRALADQGKPVPIEKLRPAPPEGGPFVLLKNEKVVRGFAAFADALKARADGDTIEIRTDGQLGEVRGVPKVDSDRKVTLRAAPGYRPSFSDFQWNALDLQAVNGIHFSGSIQLPCAGMSNCLVEGDSTFHISEQGDKAGITNCLCRGVRFEVGGAQPDKAPIRHKALIRNSAVAWVYFHFGEDQLELQQCVVGNGAGRDWLLWAHSGSLGVRARGTLFVADLGHLFNTAVNAQSWTEGSNNVYQIADWNFVPYLRSTWKSPETRSLVIEPALADPKQWRLLPQSPGYRAGPGGKDFGPDVSRIGIYVDADRRAAQWWCRSEE